ncbi:hypothetical protein C2E31_09705 [Rhodopirellula baltica]|nr:hypothetical protein C2E31_09705 [Rhodopirellula baltica]
MQNGRPRARPPVPRSNALLFAASLSFANQLAVLNPHHALLDVATQLPLLLRPPKNRMKLLRLSTVPPLKPKSQTTAIPMTSY